MMGYKSKGQVLKKLRNTLLFLPIRSTFNLKKQELTSVNRRISE